MTLNINSKGERAPRPESRFMEGLKEKLDEAVVKVSAIKDERMRILDDVRASREGAMENFRDCLERLQKAEGEEREAFLELADAMEKEHPELRE